MLSKLSAVLRRKKKDKKDKSATTETPKATAPVTAAIAETPKMATPDAAPAEVKAIVIQAGNTAEIKTIPTPKLRDDYVLVKTTAVALNPTDHKHVDTPFGGNPVGAIVGCDFAGVVVEVGSKVERKWKKGDRIAGPVHGGNKANLQDGAFAEYIVAKGDLAIPIPDNVSDTDAATLGIGLTTIGQSLYQGLKLSLPSSPVADSPPILIWGGSTATGLLGIQFATLSGYAVHTTSSPHNFEYLKSLGAVGVYDYHSPTVGSDIKAATGGKLKLAFDCSPTAETAKACAMAMSEEGGKYASLLPVPPEATKDVNDKIENVGTLYYTVFGEAFEKFKPFPANAEDLEFGKTFWELGRKLLAEGKVKTARAFVDRDGKKGLEGVMAGLDELRQGKVSGGKLVYTL